MLGEDRGAVVVIALIIRLDVPVGLARERADYVGEHIISEPCHTVVVGLACPHPVARNARVAHRAGGGLALVVPDGEESASVADGKIGLPLKAGSGIGIQLEWRAKGHPAVGGADVIDVAGVGAGAVLGINEANYVVVGGRLTPSHVPPGVGAIHAHEVGIGGAISAAGGSEGGAGVGVGPGGAAVSGLPRADALSAAACSEKNSEESAGRFVVESNRVAKVRPVASGEGAWREAGEGRAAVRGE